MTALDLRLQGARVLLPDEGLTEAELGIAQGVICNDPVGRCVDLSG